MTTITSTCPSWCGEWHDDDDLDDLDAHIASFGPVSVAALTDAAGALRSVEAFEERLNVGPDVAAGLEDAAAAMLRAAAFARALVEHGPNSAEVAALLP